MNFKVQKVDLGDVLSKVQGLTGRKSSLAITSNVLVRTAENAIVILATDLETGFEGVYPAEVGESGQIALNSRKLYEIIRDFPSEEIRFNEIENHWIEIRDKTVEYHLVGMNPEEFPDIPRIEAAAYLDLEAGALKKMIEKTVVITGSADDRRAHIIGVFLEKITDGDDQKLRMVSTDGSRLATVDQICANGNSVDFADGLLIPKKGLHEINKFLDAQTVIQIGFQDNHLIVKKENEILVVRLLEGIFPKYREIIQREEGHLVIIDKQAFAMMLKRMSILSSENYKSVFFNFEKEKLTVTSTNPDIGECKEQMAIDFPGKPLEVAFNPKFFLEALSAIDSDKIRLDILDGEKPCLLTGESDQSYLGVIMPMRI